MYLITAGLGEFKLRDLNDEINKLLREKGHWEDRIKELNGPDYRVSIYIYNAVVTHLTWLNMTGILCLSLIIRFSNN